jgi:hypothetical protein
MNKTKLLEEIFQDDEKLEIYLNELFLNPPRQNDVLLNSTNVDFLTKYRKDGRTDVMERAIHVLYDSCDKRFGNDVRIVPLLSIEGDRTKMTLVVYKDKNSINKSEINVKKRSTLVLIDELRILAEDTHCKDGVAISCIKEAADRLDELDSDLFTQKNLARKCYLELRKIVALHCWDNDLINQKRAALKFMKFSK